ncbi:hypothetical protein [Enterococcus sp. FR088]|uniref:hypothetical protein n=1 Tax=Enterococcus sp. FR088 TaxID=2923496 RepID=UPI00280EE5B5|nr:hypothetical protein [Enterococcus sp. FR088]MDQ8611391.1 hypothetical protein [Enterococcus sp. FR088]
MADQVNIDLLGQAYCNVMTRKTGITHTYTIKGKDDKKQNEKNVQIQRRKMLEFLDENFADILKKGSN